MGHCEDPNEFAPCDPVKGCGGALSVSLFEDRYIEHFLNCGGKFLGIVLNK